MKKKTLLFTIALMFLSMSLFAGDSPEMGKGRHPGMKDGDNYHGRMHFEERIKEALELSDKQFDQLEKLRMELDKKAAKIKIQIAKKELDIKELLLEDDIDFKAIKMVLKEINDLDYELKIIKILHLEKSSKILTKEQFAKFKNHFFRGDKKEKMMKMMKKKKIYKDRD
ncbi:hypothetical protein KAU32_03690 [bacterium]|nr:hypothetical protein [bacterium]